MAEPSKDTIYVDVDDEITALIDKVKASNAKVVALVLPKRASVLQSIVNMKLLKRSADNDNKNLVLITTESGLLPLAGAVGMYVAKTLTSKPEIPPGPNVGAASDNDEVEEDLSLPLDNEDEELPDLAASAAGTTPVGALSDKVPKSINADKAKSADETLEMDAEPNNKPSRQDSKVQDSPASKIKKDKHIKVPNFDRFRWLLILGIVLIAGLAVLGYFAFYVWPSAVIQIKTDASTVNTSLNLTLDPQAQASDISTGDIPAKQVSEQKTFTQTVNTTGQKNEGNTASGQVNLTASDCNGTYTQDGGTFTIPAGTGISYNNMTYITQSDTQMGPDKHLFSGNCINYVAASATNITAQSGGSQYNTQISNATVSGFPEVIANGSASGGTDNIVQVVAQADISAATSKIGSADATTVKQDLINELKGQGLYPIEVTFASGTPQISSNPSVGNASSTVTVTETISYSMFGASQSDLNAALTANIRSQTSPNQNIIDNGLNQSAFRQTGTSGSTDQVSLSTLAVVGPNISVSQIKKAAANKTPAEIITAVKNNPDVTSVTIRLSPFWVNKAPANTAKIKVSIAKPTQSAK